MSEYIDNILDRITAQLFFLPSHKLASALESLPIGMLWQACLPQITPQQTFANLAQDTKEVLVTMAQAWQGSDGEALSAVLKLPCILDTNGNLSALGEALANDGAKMIERAMNLDLKVTGEEAAIWGIEITYHGLDEWESRVYECIDYYAENAFAGQEIDAVEALIKSPNKSVYPILPFASSEARIRFIEALADGVNSPGEKMQTYKQSFFRRSCASTLMQDIKRNLLALKGGTYGFSPEGWPLWWHTICRDTTSAIAALPPEIVELASNIKLLPNAIGISGGENE